MSKHISFRIFKSGRRRGVAARCDAWPVVAIHHAARQLAGGVWSPDGSRLILSKATSVLRIYQTAVERHGHGGAAFRRTGRLQSASLLDWSRDGKLLVYQVQSRAQGWDLLLLPLEGDRQPVPYLQYAGQRDAAGSSRRMADGWRMPRMIRARRRFTFRRFPLKVAERQISTAGGDQPRWRRDGHELFYIASDQTLMAVPVKTGVALEPDDSTTVVPDRPREPDQARVRVPAHFGRPAVSGDRRR